VSRKKKPYDRTVFRSIALIMQFGINMLVPICLTAVVGAGALAYFLTLFVLGFRPRDFRRRGA